MVQPNAGFGHIMAKRTSIPRLGQNGHSGYRDILLCNARIRLCKAPLGPSLPWVGKQERVRNMRRIGWVALWHGGNSYAAPNNGDAEFFPTLEAAKREFEYRYAISSAVIRPVYILPGNRAIQSGLVREHVGTPVVDETAHMFLAPMFSDETMGEYSKLIEFGPRRGVRVIDI